MDLDAAVLLFELSRATFSLESRGSYKKRSFRLDLYVKMMLYIENLNIFVLFKVITLSNKICIAIVEN